MKNTDDFAYHQKISQTPLTSTPFPAYSKRHSFLSSLHTLTSPVRHPPPNPQDKLSSPAPLHRHPRRRLGISDPISTHLLK